MRSSRDSWQFRRMTQESSRMLLYEQRCTSRGSSGRCPVDAVAMSSFELLRMARQLVCNRLHWGFELNQAVQMVSRMTMELNQAGIGSNQTG